MTRNRPPASTAKTRAMGRDVMSFSSSSASSPHVGTGIVSAEFDKIFYPTKSVYLANGDEAIESFSDRYKSKDAASADEDGEDLKRHLVIVTRKDIGELGAVAANETGPDALAAGDALEYIQSCLDKYEGVAANTPIPLKNNLFLFIANVGSLKELRVSKQLNADNGLDGKLQVICQNNAEAILHRIDGFNSSIVTFDKVNPNIRREGIKHIQNDDLYAELIGATSSQGRSTFPLSLISDFVTKLFPNQYILVKPESGGEPIIGHVIGDINWNRDRSRFKMGELELRVIPNKELYGQNSLGIKPRDIGQRLYMHALRQQHLSRIFVTGEAACGKTLIGYAGALEQTLKHRTRDAEKLSKAEVEEGHALSSRFKRIFITKTNDLLGGRERERGFLPGNEYEKMFADIQSYIDAHDELELQISLPELVFGTGADAAGGQKRGGMDRVQFREAYHGLYAPSTGGVIKVQDYAHWRGRTIASSAIFLDEAQNLHPIEFKHLNQRVGTGSLVIIGGDYEHQMDNESMSKTSNGLFQGLRHFLGQPYVAVLNLEGSYRDAGAEHASRMRVYR